MKVHKKSLINPPTSTDSLQVNIMHCAIKSIRNNIVLKIPIDYWFVFAYIWGVLWFAHHQCVKYWLCPGTQNIIQINEMRKIIGTRRQHKDYNNGKESHWYKTNKASPLSGVNVWYDSFSRKCRFVSHEARLK